MLEKKTPMRWLLPGLYAILLLVALVGAITHFYFGFSDEGHPLHAWGSDDAYISYRYAANLAEGNGLVFNPGERVEGYTNFLYVVVLAGFMRTFPADVYTLSFCVNMACYVSTLILFAWYVKKTLSPWGAILACSALYLCPLMWVWPSSGMETSFVLLVQLAVFIAVELGSRNPTPRSLVLLCSLTAVSILLRADGFVFPLICSVLYLFRSRYREFVIFAVFIVLVSGLYIVARYCYYGAILPNTYYAKVCGTAYDRIYSGAVILERLSQKDFFFLYVVTVFLGWNPFVLKLFRERKLDLSLIPAVPVAATGLMAYWFHVGGDIYYERFLLAIIPLSLINFFYLLGDPRDWKAPRLLWKPAIVLLVMAAQFMPYANDRRFYYQSTKYDMWICLGKFLSEKYPDATLATCAAGKVPFYSRLDTLDMLGLNDAYIGRRPMASWFAVGHCKFDPDYVLSREPQLIATWGFSNLDLGWGLTRAKYAVKGYTIKYMLNSSPQSKDVNVVNVEGFSDKQIADLMSQQYNFVVAVKGNKPPTDAATVTSRPSKSVSR